MWYSSGTVTVENGSAAVIGDGTAFLSNVRVGDGIAIEGSLALHEIVNVSSEAGIVVKPAYDGPTGTGLRFTAVPVLGYDKDLSDAFNRIRLEMGEKVQGLQPWAYANTAAEARDEMGLGSGATGDVVQGAGDSQTDVMSQKATTDALATKVDSSDPRLSDAREWTASTVTQAEAEAGTASTRRAWTAQRVKQAIAAWYLTVSTGFTRTLLGRSTAAQVRGDLGLGTAASRDVGTGYGNVMGVGAFGLGSGGADFPAINESTVTAANTSFLRGPGLSSAGWANGYGQAILFKRNTNNATIIEGSVNQLWFQNMHTGTLNGWNEILHTGNIRASTGQSTKYPMTQKAVTDAINGVSDRRDKIDITSNDVGLNLIEKLEPVSFKLNKRDWYRAQAATTVETSADEEGVQTQVEKIDPTIISNPLTDYDSNDGSLARDDKYTGLIAQDVKATLEDLGLGDLAIIKNYSDEYGGGDDRHYIEYNGLIPIMINAIKELNERVKVLEEKHDS